MAFFISRNSSSKGAASCSKETRENWRSMERNNPLENKETIRPFCASKKLVQRTKNVG